MKTPLEQIIGILLEIREDIDAIHHHQTDRIVQELNDVIDALRDSIGQNFGTR